MHLIYVFTDYSAYIIRIYLVEKLHNSYDVYQVEHSNDVCDRAVGLVVQGHAYYSGRGQILRRAKHHEANGPVTTLVHLRGCP